jgi:hypothetical protein
MNFIILILHSLISSVLLGSPVSKHASILISPVLQRMATWTYLNKLYLCLVLVVVLNSPRSVKPWISSLKHFLQNPSKLTEFTYTKFLQCKPRLSCLLYFFLRTRTTYLPYVTSRHTILYSTLFWADHQEYLYNTNSWCEITRTLFYF